MCVAARAVPFVSAAGVSNAQVGSGQSLRRFLYFGQDTCQQLVKYCGDQLEQHRGEKTHEL